MYNSHRPQSHSFKIVEETKYGGNIVECPVCGIRRWDSAMRIHIAKANDQEHKNYYQENTFEETITRRVWKI